jgi:hypothetical protein
MAAETLVGWLLCKASKKIIYPTITSFFQTARFYEIQQMEHLANN